jgi:hypothetical protein
MIDKEIDKEEEMGFGADSMVKDILNDEQARAVIERHLPGAITHPLLPEAMYLTLGEVAGYPEAGISPQVFAQIVDELSRLASSE